MAVGRFSRRLGRVVVIAMPNAELDTTRQVEVHPGSGVLPLLLNAVAVRVLIDCRCVADGVEVAR